MKKLLIIPTILVLLSCSSLPSFDGSFPSLDFSSSYNSASSEIDNPIIDSSLNSNQSSSSSQNSSEEHIEIPEYEKIKIYLNPSVQKANMYYGNVCSEAEAMNIVSSLIYNELIKDPRFIVYHNDRMLSLKESVIESNSLDVDYHLALHSNAGGGSGSECYYITDSSFAYDVLDTFNQYHTFPNRGIKKGSHLYELKNSTADNKALLEFLFHDNAIESNFIRKNYSLLAEAVVETFKDIADRK